MTGMNVKPATTHPKATEEIGGMVEMISTLMEKGYAYNVNGTVYFRKFSSTENFPIKNLDDLRSGGRSLLVTGEDQKEDPWISFSGNRKKRASPPGLHPGATAVPAGILSAPSCQKISG